LSSSFFGLEPADGVIYTRKQIKVGDDRWKGEKEMSDNTIQILIEAAKAYETLFVPALFGQWAPMVAAVAQIQPDQQVLDVACGTGILGREIAARVGPGGHVAGVDPNPGMLAVAQQLAPDVEWREASAESLPFPDGSFDAVVGQFGLVFFTNQCQALGEMLRVLKPGGRMAVAVWDSLENLPAYAAEVALLEQIAGQPAADALRAPFAIGDRRILATLFADCGITSADITTHSGVAQFPSIRTMVEADLRGWLPVMGVLLMEQQIDRILSEADQALGDYTTADGRAMFPLSAHIVAVKKGGS
jgi:SAM-dependent methyltransferase